MNFLVTGGAGFIGSNLVDRLLRLGHSVVAYDNFSTGSERNLSEALSFSSFRLVRGDIHDIQNLTDAMEHVDLVFHLAANADIRFGLQHPRKDLDQNVIATFNVLEAMRHVSVKRIVFASTGSIYGEPEVFPTPETAPFPMQTSLYGAAKQACEGFIQAYCEGFGFQGYIFRFVSILGERYSHGHVVDFYRNLRHNPNVLHVLGDGRQRKSYLHVQDCIDAMLLTIEEVKDKVNIFNLGADEYCEVNDSVRWVCDCLGLSPEVTYSGGKRGWVGDSPFIYLDCRKIRALGWKPKLTIKESVVLTLEYLMSNESTCGPGN